MFSVEIREKRTDIQYYKQLAAEVEKTGVTVQKHSEIHWEANYVPRVKV